MLVSVRDRVGEDVRVAHDDREVVHHRDNGVQLKQRPGADVVRPSCCLKDSLNVETLSQTFEYK